MKFKLMVWFTQFIARHSWIPQPIFGYLYPKCVVWLENNKK